jgi:hypothetical protein
MHQHAGFHAEFGGGGFQYRFEGSGVERVGFGEGVAELFQARFVFGNETLFRGLGVVSDFVLEIKRWRISLRVLKIS